MPEASQGPMTCEPIRETFAAGDIEGQRAWLRRDVDAPFHVPRKLPIVKAARPKEIAAVQRSLFELCGDPAAIQPGVVGRAKPKAIQEPAPAEIPFAQVPLTADEQVAIDEFAIGEAFHGEGFAARERWRSWISVDAVPTTLPGPLLRRKQHAQVRFTQTRLGFTAGYSYDARDMGCGGGGYTFPCVDREGWYVWLTRQAAIHAGGHELYDVVLKHDAPAAAEVRAYLLQQGVDVATPPDASLQRRLVSRNRIAKLKSGPAPDDCDEPDPDEAVLAYERAVGLTDVDGPPAESSPAKRKGGTKPPSARLTALIDDAGVGRRRPREVAIVEAAIAVSHDASETSFVDEILSVREHPEGLVARVRLFDGGIGMLTVAGGSVCGWVAEGDLRDFGHFDGEWVRIDEPVTPPAAEAVPEPTLVLTFDMGRWMKAHGKDRIDFEPALDKPHRVSCPPFHLHDEDSLEPVDEFLGQVVAFLTDTRALLFRRRDPYFLDGCEVGQRYILMRFHDDKEGQVWSMPVDGEADEAVHDAIRTTTALYRGHARAAQ